MSHPQMTAAIATQHCQDLNRNAQQARRIKQAKDEHGIRVVHRTVVPQASPSLWTRVVTAVSKTTTVAPAPEPKLA